MKGIFNTMHEFAHTQSHKNRKPRSHLPHHAYHESDQVHMTANRPTHLLHTQDNNLCYNWCTFLYGASKNSVSLLGLHGERSLRVSSVQALRMTGEAGVKMALGARGVVYQNVKSNMRLGLDRQYNNDTEFDDNTMDSMTNAGHHRFNNNPDSTTPMRIRQLWYKFNNATGWNVMMMKAGRHGFDHNNTDSTMMMWIRQWRCRFDNDDVDSTMTMRIRQPQYEFDNDRDEIWRE